MSRSTYIISVICLVSVGTIALVSTRIWSKPMVVVNSQPLPGEGSFLKEAPATTTSPQGAEHPQPSQPVTTPVTSTPHKPSEVPHFTNTFSDASIIEEAGQRTRSSDSNWWVNSGGRLVISDGVARTIQGDLPASDKWYREYLRNNPTDTDKGLHPQNIFRLVHTNQWKNFEQHVYFKINKINLSDSPNRNASNGVLLFNRYQTGDNLYYTGIRVDGAVVIKKKIHGHYHTLASKYIYSGTKYDRDSNPNLLPSKTWIGIKSELITKDDGSVIIRLFTDVERTGKWKFVLQAEDTGGRYGPAILDEGFAGIRTDFMDVEFDDYRISAMM